MSDVVARAVAARRAFRDAHAALVAALAAPFEAYWAARVAADRAHAAHRRAYGRLLPAERAAFWLAVGAEFEGDDGALGPVIWEGARWS